MEDKDLQKHLLYITKLKVQNFNSNKIRAVTAIWKDNTAHLSFYFNEKPTEEELEEVSDICTEVIAHMPKGMLEDKYFIWEYPKPLPNEFLAYKFDR